MRRDLRYNVRERIRLRLRARLDELGMSARELAQAVRPIDEETALDSWISGILTGAQALSWKHFDSVCEVLRMSPGELVRYDDSELRELRPHEMRLLRHYQQWPAQIQERWLRVLDYFAASVPDDESARLLEDWKGLSQPEKRRLRLFLAEIQRGTLPPAPGPAGDPQEKDEESGARDTTLRLGHEKTTSDSHDGGDGRKMKRS